jgi:hypothetical protein
LPRRQRGDNAAAGVAGDGVWEQAEMAFTFSVKAWKDVRPSEAKGLGVEEAIKAVEASCPDKVTDLTAAKCDSATKDINDLSDAFDKARKKIAGLKSTSATKALAKLKVCDGELDDYLEKLKARKYAIRAEPASEQYRDVYEKAREALTAAYKDALKAEAELARGVLPKRDQIVGWMMTVETSGKKFSKTYFPSLPAFKAGGVKADDVTLPDDLKQVKGAADKLKALCLNLAEATRSASRAAVEALDERNEVEKELKSLLSGYKELEGNMQVLIAKFAAVAVNAKALAEEVKAAIAGNLGKTEFQRLANEALDLKATRGQFEEAVVKLNATHRNGNGALSKRYRAMTQLPGWDEKKHGVLARKRQDAADVSVKECSVSALEIDRQIQRVRTMYARTSYQGYIGNL